MGSRNSLASADPTDIAPRHHSDRDDHSPPAQPEPSFTKGPAMPITYTKRKPKGGPSSNGLIPASDADDSSHLDEAKSSPDIRPLTRGAVRAKPGQNGGEVDGGLNGEDGDCKWGAEAATGQAQRDGPDAAQASTAPPAKRRGRPSKNSQSADVPLASTAGPSAASSRAKKGRKSATGGGREARRKSAGSPTPLRRNSPRKSVARSSRFSPAVTTAWAPLGRSDTLSPPPTLDEPASLPAPTMLEPDSMSNAAPVHEGRLSDVTAPPFVPESQVGFNTHSPSSGWPFATHPPTAANTASYGSQQRASAGMIGNAARYSTPGALPGNRNNLAPYPYGAALRHTAAGVYQAPTRGLESMQRSYHIPLDQQRALFESRYDAAPAALKATISRLVNEGRTEQACTLLLEGPPAQAARAASSVSSSGFPVAGSRGPPMPHSQAEQILRHTLAAAAAMQHTQRLAALNAPRGPDTPSFTAPLVTQSRAEWIPDTSGAGGPSVGRPAFTHVPAALEEQYRTGAYHRAAPQVQTSEAAGTTPDALFDGAATADETLVAPVDTLRKKAERKKTEQSGGAPSNLQSRTRRAVVGSVDASPTALGVSPKGGKVEAYPIGLSAGTAERYPTSGAVQSRSRADSDATISDAPPLSREHPSTIVVRAPKERTNGAGQEAESSSSDADSSAMPHTPPEVPTNDVSVIVAPTAAPSVSETIPPGNRKRASSLDAVAPAPDEGTRPKRPRRSAPAPKAALKDTITTPKSMGTPRAAKPRAAPRRVKAEMDAAAAAAATTAPPPPDPATLRNFVRPQGYTPSPWPGLIKTYASPYAIACARIAAISGDSVFASPGVEGEGEGAAPLRATLGILSRSTVKRCDGHFVVDPPRRLGGFRRRNGEQVGPWVIAVRCRMGLQGRYGHAALIVTDTLTHEVLSARLTALFDRVKPLGVTVRVSTDPQDGDKASVLCALQAHPSPSWIITSVPDSKWRDPAEGDFGDVVASLSPAHQLVCLRIFLLGRERLHPKGISAMKRWEMRGPDKDFAFPEPRQALDGQLAYNIETDLTSGRCNACDEEVPAAGVDTTRTRGVRLDQWCDHLLHDLITRYAAEPMDLPQPAAFYTSEGNSFRRHPVPDVFLSPADDPGAARGMPSFEPSETEFAAQHAYLRRVWSWGCRSGTLKIKTPRGYFEELMAAVLPRLREMIARLPAADADAAATSVSAKATPKGKGKGKGKSKAGQADNNIVVGQDLLTRPPDRTIKARLKSPAMLAGGLGARIIDGETALVHELREWVVEGLKRVPEAVRPAPAGRGGMAGPGTEVYERLDMQPEAEGLVEVLKRHQASFLGEDGEVDPELVGRLVQMGLAQLASGHQYQYASDVEATALPPDETLPWNLRHIYKPMCTMPPSAGLNRSSNYWSVFASAFEMHEEDLALPSYNINLIGSPKIWYGVPNKYSAALVHATRDLIPETRLCPEFLRHKELFITPSHLSTLGVPAHTMPQFPGDLMITFPGGFHSGLNLGVGLAEAINGAARRGLRIGQRAVWCPCGKRESFGETALSFLLEKDLALDYADEKQPLPESIEAVLHQYEVNGEEMDRVWVEAARRRG